MVEIPMISIKIKGLQAIQALGANGSLNLKGAAVLAQDAASHLGQVEAIRIGAVKAGKVVAVKTVEVEGAGTGALGANCPLAEIEAKKIYIVAKGAAAKSSGAAAAKALGPAGPA